MRIKIGVSQQELAERLNVTPVWLNQIENKKKTSSKMESKIIEELNKIEIEKYGIGIPTLS
jgi:transcriptional regulator with XRE-family HTH domain